MTWNLRRIHLDDILTIADPRALDALRAVIEAAGPRQGHVRLEPRLRHQGFGDQGRGADVVAADAAAPGTAGGRGR